MISKATINDAEAILELQRIAYQSEAIICNDWSLAPLTQTIESLQEEFVRLNFLKAILHGQMVGSVRAQLQADVCEIGRLIVHPNFQRQGIGSELLRAIEASFPEATAFELFTSTKSRANIRLYQKHGYAASHTRTLSPTVSLIFVQKAQSSTA